MAHSVLSNSEHGLQSAHSKLSRIAQSPTGPRLHLAIHHTGHVALGADPNDTASPRA